MGLESSDQGLGDYVLGELNHGDSKGKEKGNWVV